MNMNKLTKAEEQVMQYLWQIEKGFLKDILELFPEPKPHTNTISTILKILMEKGFVSHKTFGRQHEYFPLVTKENYSGKSIRSLVKNYFEGSYTNAVSVPPTSSAHPLPLRETQPPPRSQGISYK